MKTSKNNKLNLNGKRLILYVAAVAAFCFLNCLALQARDYTSRYAYSYEANINVANESQAAPLFQVRSWNLDFQTMLISYIIQHRIQHSQVRARQAQAPVREYNARPVSNTKTKKVDTWSFNGNDRRNEF